MKPYEDYDEEEEIDRDYIYKKSRTLDDLDDKEYDWLEKNDPDRLAEIGDETNEKYRKMMYPDGEDDDQNW